jgi:hypothetical protein
MTEEPKKQQVFMLLDNSVFKWQGTLYHLLRCTDDYTAKVYNLRTGHVENFNACASVLPIGHVRKYPLD